VILANLSANKTPAIRAWATRHKVELCFTPTNASWANPIEAQFGPLRTFTMSNSDHPHHTVLARNLQNYGEFAHTPPGKRQAQLRRSGSGRRHDERDVIGADQAGTTSRPPRVQRRQPPLVQIMDHSAHGVLVRGDQPRDRGHRRPRRRRHDDQRTTDPDRLMPAPSNNLLQPAPLLVSQPPSPNRFSHHAPTLDRQTVQPHSEINKRQHQGCHPACHQPRLSRAPLNFGGGPRDRQAAITLSS
jgi:hypothetical protein